MATFNPTAETSLQLKRTFSAPREKVFRAWTEPEALKQWFVPRDGMSTPTVEVDLRVGGKYRIVMKSPTGELYVAIGTYREVRFPEKLVFTWTFEGSELGETVVTLEFHDQNGSTELVLTHQFFPNKEERDKHTMGWNGCLDHLAKFL
jgi:uncharacterized protein YndB with AHSA1/START domain